MVVLSRQFRRRVRPLGASSSRLTVSPSGAWDPNLPAPTGRRQSGVPLTVTYVGRMKASKGPQFLLRAMARVQRLAPPTRVWLIGTGPTLPALRRLSRRLGVRRVTFWGYQRDVYRFLRRSDILVVPGLDETFPMALIEGLLAGQAVVASRCGGIPDMIEHGRTGLLFPPGNTRVLARHLLRLLTNDRLRLRLATQGQRHARSRFSLQRMIADMEAVYASLASG